MCIKPWQKKWQDKEVLFWLPYHRLLHAVQLLRTTFVSVCSGTTRKLQLEQTGLHVTHQHFRQETVKLRLNSPLKSYRAQKLCFKITTRNCLSRQDNANSWHCSSPLPADFEMPSCYNFPEKTKSLRSKEAMTTKWLINSASIYATIAFYSANSGKYINLRA